MDAKVLYQQAESRLRQGDWQLAAQLLLQLLEIAPDHASANHLLGKALARLGDLEAAEVSQRRSCVLDPSLGWNWFALAELCERRGALHDSSVAFSKAAEALPDLRWIQDRARRMRRQLEWEQIKSLAVEPRFVLKDLMQVVWQLRPDLRQRFGDDQSELLLWLLLDGSREYVATLVFRDELVDILKPLAEQRAVLPALPVGHAHCCEPPICQFLHEIWFYLPRLQTRFDLQTLAGRVGFFWWYVLEALDYYQLYELLSPQQLGYIFEPPEPDSSDSQIRLMSAARRKSEVHVHHADLDAWFRGKGISQFRLGPLVAKDPLHRFSESSSIVYPALDQAGLGSSSQTFAYGVNLIGYARGQLGVGEDVRMAAKALDAAAIPYSVYNVDPDPSISCGDDSLNARFSEDLPFRFNLFCTSAVETARLAITEYLPLMQKGYVNIGFWPWEFSRWPGQWDVCYRMIDEVWASTAFTAEAYRRDDHGLPVQLMPMVVDISASAGKSRSYFGLPEFAHLFVFSFDCSSTIKRKNPMAVVEAFQRAFPLDSTADVALVVKVMRGDSRVSAYRRLKQRASLDRRIYLIDQTLSRDILLDLYRVCDTYVSLHRSEGFGRGIAEAMLLGKSVIATSYSGNLDFCTEETALMVPISYLSRVLPGEYPEAVGLQWAEPDLSHAAQAMWACAVQGWKPEATAVAKIARQYSASNVGKQYKKRFDQLMSIM